MRYLGLFLASAALYTLTWSGRYFHDGGLFAQMFEDGLLVWHHVLYLPTGEAIHWVVSLFAETRREFALEVLSIGSAAGALTLSARLVESLLAWAGAPRQGRAFWIAVLILGVAPSYWFGGATVEIHIFSALGAVLAAWLVWWGRLGLFVGPFVAIVFAGTTHQTCGLLWLGYCVLAWLACERRGRKAPFWQLAASAVLTPALGFVVVYFKGTSANAAVEGSVLAIGAETFRALVNLPYMASRFVGENLAPWGIVVVATLLVPAVSLLRREPSATPDEELSDASPEPRGSAGLGDTTARASLDLTKLRSLAMLAFAGLLPIFVFAQVGPFNEGQYVLPATCFLLLGLVLFAQSFVGCCRGWKAAAMLLVVAQIGWSFYYARQLAKDPIADWARATQALVQEPAVLVTRHPARVLWARRLLSKTAVHNIEQFGGLYTPKQVVDYFISVVPGEVQKGNRVYLDRSVVWPEPNNPFMTPLGRELVERLKLGPPRDVPVVEVGR